MKCLAKCKELGVSCPVQDCRYWIDYEKEMNCVFKTVEVNDTLTLRECASRLGVSYVRIKQIEDATLKKMRHLTTQYSN